jgi:UDP-N-acetylglucosamine--N-acetylmuramyl-(pentapeptide) pyrophosphoryl-undecaprenol N-acetylglucosamine transferase
MSKTILIAAGGTGGHLYPAIAVAEEIRRERPDIKIIFIGTRERIEAQEVPRAGFPFVPISIEAPGKSIASMIRFPFKFSSAIVESLRLISKEKPAAMLGAGAYLSVPAGLAAWAFHVPIALLEINAIGGTANKLLSKVADKLFVAYGESRTQFSKRVSETATVSGTPVRAGMGDNQTTSAEEARASFGLDPARTTILVFGGSLGARAINDAMQSVAAPLSARGLNILWQTGKSADIEKLKAEFVNQPNVRVADYIYDMERAYAAADLVVCRAGASSLAELSRIGKPAVLVPYPFAAAGHQEENARAFERDGAALVLRDQELKEKLDPTIRALIEDKPKLQSMSEAMKRRANPDAAKVVAQWLIERTK